jgi:AAA family ATP:ADP antiporter
VTSPATPPRSPFAAVLGKLGTIEPGEMRATLLACLYFFFLLASYFILRSVRDAVGVAAGVRNLPWLFTGTLIATLLLNPVFSRVVSTLPVRRFIPIVYRTFGVLLLGFMALLLWAPTSYNGWIQPAFWIWTSVFSLFVPSVFWGFMADTFHPEQSKRLFGFISVGGTLGALAGSALTASLATVVGTPMLMLMSAILLETAVQVVRRFPPSFRSETREREAARRPLGGSSFAGMINVVKSPYLLGICVYMLLFTIGTTILYFQQADIVAAAYDDRESRTAFLARIDFTVQLLTVLAQLFITGRVIKWFGVGFALAILPVMSIVGFGALGMATTLGVFVAFQVLRRAGNYAFADPARQVLFTVVPPEDKYKAKNLIDTFVYRGGDQIGAWSTSGLTALGLTMSGISFIAAPLSAVWLGVALWLGRRQRQLQAGAEAH